MKIRENLPNYIERPCAYYYNLEDFLNSDFWKWYQPMIYGIESRLYCENNYHVLMNYIEEPIRRQRMLMITLDEFEKIEPIVNHINDVCAKTENYIKERLAESAKRKEALKNLNNGNRMR